MLPAIYHFYLQMAICRQELYLIAGFFYACWSTNMAASFDSKYVSDQLISAISGESGEDNTPKLCV
jgi:hypothetical protein